MKRMTCWLLVLLMVAGLNTVFAEDASPILLAKTQYGAVSGVAETSDIAIFKGIPFAAPPIGDLRWKAPQDPEPWEGVLACDEYAPMAMQILSTTDWYGPEFYYEYIDSFPNMSEDCLYLNVVTPATSTDDSYPVIVFFHGGASMHGYTYEPEFDSVELARNGAVVVTIPYRLGLFGFMALPELSDEADYGTSGNYALLDLIKGLQWVQDNIAQFGGDPNRVSVNGQSAGAGCVNNLMISPLADGLFQSAFMSTRGFNIFSSLATIESKYESCASYLEGKGYGEMTLEELRELPTSAFVNETTEKPEIYNKGFGACLDGYVLPYHPVEVFTQEGGLKGVDVMFGNNDGDNNDTFSIITMEDFYSSNQKTYGDLYAKYDFESLYVPSDDVGATMVNLELRSQQRTTQNLLNARYLSKLNPDSDIYVFLFSHWTPGRESSIRKAWHSADLWYWFDSMRDIPEQRDWTALDYMIGDLCSSYWVNFAATGSPNSADVPYWPAVTENSPVFMDLGDTFVVRSNFYESTYKADRDNLMLDLALTQYPVLSMLFE